MSIEGLRLFEAHDDGTLTIRRALPPFDRPALADGMMQDIRLIFFRPEAPPLLSGTMPSGEPGCRYTLADGIEDIVRKPSGEMVIHRYDGKNRLIRRVDHHALPSGWHGRTRGRSLPDSFGSLSPRPLPARTGPGGSPADGGQPLKSVLAYPSLHNHDR